MAAAATIRSVLELHRAQLQGVIEIRGVRRMRKIYEEARADLQAKLGALTRAGGGATFTAQHYRIMLVQVSQALAEFAPKFQRHLNDTGEMAAKLGANQTVAEIQKFEKAFTGQSPVLQTAQVGVLRRIYRDTEPSLLLRHAKSMALYGRPVVEAIHKQMALSLAQGETVDQTVERVAGTSGIFARERYRAERIVRTEGSYAFHATKLVSMQTLATEVPDMRKSMVSTFDARTGKDSDEQNQQVRKVGEPFEYHVLDDKGNRTGKVIHYQAPPNRPNDRAVMIPWREGWATKKIGEPGAVDPRVPSESASTLE